MSMVVPCLITRRGVIPMKKYVLGALVSALVVSVVLSTPAYAFYCPVLVKECLTTVDKVAKKDGTDKKKLDQAKKGCDEAQKLHEGGKHKASVVKAGESIALAGKAAK
jgi:type IV secretory pathway VirB6-like protein